MNQSLFIQVIDGEGRRRLGSVAAPETILGREDNGPGSLKVENTAISRKHGRLLFVGPHLFYEDFGSTNGSWVNGQKLLPNSAILVRVGDIIQLANVVLRLVSESSVTETLDLGAVTLVVIKSGEYLSEFNVPEYGRALVVGGAKCDLKLVGSLSDLPALVIERKGADVTAYSVSGEEGFTLDGEPAAGPVVLKDRSTLMIADYRIILNDCKSGSESRVRSSTSSLKDWDDQNEIKESHDPAENFRSKRLSSASLVFGKTDGPPVSETLAIDPEEVQGRISAYEQNRVSEDDTQLFSTIEDKVMVFVGIILLVMLIGVVIWWAFFK